MTPISPDLANELIETAEALADAAGKAILPHFRSRDLSTENKLAQGFDPVTVADRAAEEAMRAVLAGKRPNDAILGEEFGRSDGTSGLIWVLDPIDGTRGFMSGTPTWGTLIAVGDDSGPLLGIVDQPYTRERFVGGLGRADWTGPHGGGELRTRDTTSLSDAVIFTTFPEVGSAAEGAAFHRVARQTKLTRYGTDCYAYALLGMGQIDLVIEAGLNAYDIQGPMAVVQAGGGIVTDWQGGPAHGGGTVLAAANETLHARALDLLNAAG